LTASFNHRRTQGEAMMKNSGPKRPKPLWLKALIGLCLLFIFIILIVAIPLGYYAYHRNMNSLRSITNSSGSGVRFEKIIVDDQILWEGPDIIVKSRTNFEKPWLDRHGRGPMPYFRAPKRFVELKLVVINEMQERETVSCMLDNRSRPCFFEVYYKKGRLSCSDCDNSSMD
jgi:hypothetical protein